MPSNLLQWSAAVVHLNLQAAIAKPVKGMLAAGLVAMFFASYLVGQNAAIPPPKPSPTKVSEQFVVLPESVTQIQWVHTLDLVNHPESVSLVNPGQCVRIGVYSTGDNRNDYLRKTKLSFRVEFAGHSEAHPLAPLGYFKMIKPEGGDFVVGALAAAGINAPANVKTMASLGVSSERWCTPADATDGNAIVDVEVESPDGHQVLEPQRIK